MATVMQLPSRHVLFVSHRSYPFGGGEEDIYDKAQWAVCAGWRVSWLSHATGQGEDATEEVVAALPNGVATYLVPPAAATPLPVALSATLARLKVAPVSVIVVIGRLIAAFAAVAATALPAPWIASYHFWTHLVALNGTNQCAPNYSIRSRLSSHRLAPEFDAVRTSAKRVTVVSPFMQRVLLDYGVCVATVLPSAPSKSFVAAAAAAAGGVPYDPADPARKWVLFLNAHYLKQGGILPELISAHKSVPVRAFFTESQGRTGAGASEAVAVLEALCTRNDARAHAPVLLESRAADVPAVLATARLVVCASVVDETFGRVAAEAMAAGVPVVLSHAGNLPYLGGDACEGTCYVPSAAKVAADTIAKLYTDASKLRAMSAHGLTRAAFVSEERVRPMFLALLEDAVVASTPTPPPLPRALLFVPWHDQGLGLQARAYVRALQNRRVDTAVCSFTPYLAEKTVTGMYQADPLEWVHPRVYYSPHVREKVTDAEVLACVDAFSATAVVVPETCWPRVFTVAALLRAQRPHVHVIGVPNAELVRRDELARHAAFHTLLANNNMCKTLLEAHAGVTGHAQLPWLGFALPAVPFAPLPKKRHVDAAKVTAVVLGGYCLDGRKQGPAIVAALRAAAAQEPRVRDAVRVVLYAQTAPSCAKTRAAIGSDADVTLHVGNLAHQQICQIYAAADVALLPTKHEGLGMGFFEALQSRCPIVTIDAPPHNEIVTERTGWLLPATPAPLVENVASLMQSQLVDAEALQAWFVAAARHTADIHARKAYLRSKAASAAQSRDFEDFGRRLETLLMQPPPSLPLPSSSSLPALLETAAEQRAELKPGPVPVPVPGPEPKPEPKPKPEPDPEPEPKPDAEPELKLQGKLEPETARTLQPEAVLETDAGMTLKRESRRPEGAPCVRVVHGGKVVYLMATAHGVVGGYP